MICTDETTIAALSPEEGQGARYGTIEVRPIWAM
jgi:hypothetical protein